MKNDLSVSARKLKEASTRLNNLTDKANKSIKMVEEFLSKSCSISTSSSTSLKIDPDGKALQRNKLIGADYFLEYRKVKNTYRLVTVSKQSNGVEMKGLELPIADCSRELKLAAITLLPGFLDKITSQISDQIDSSEIITESVYDAMCELTEQGE